MSFGLLATAVAPEALAGRRNREATGTEEMRTLLLENCPVTDAAAGVRESIVGTLAAILLPKLVEKGIGLAAGALRKASGQDEASTTRTAEAAGYFYRGRERKVAGRSWVEMLLAEEMGCIVVVKGRFGPPNGDQPDWNSMKPASSTTDLTWRFDEIGLQALPSFYFETTPELSADNAAFRLRGAYLFSNEPSSKPRDVAISYTFATPGGDTEAFASGNLIFEKLPARIKLSEMSGKSTPWMPLRSLDTGIQELLAEYRQDLAAIEGLRNVVAELTAKENQAGLTEAERQQKADANAGVKRLDRIQGDRLTVLEVHSPTNLKVAMTETQDVNKWLLMVAEALDESRADLTTAVVDRVLPETEEEKTAILLGTLGKKQALHEALLDVETAELALEAAETANPVDEAKVIEKRKALFQARMAANVKAVEAGEAMPFPEVV
jgi:hypothetical protein